MRLDNKLILCDCWHWRRYELYWGPSSLKFSCQVGWNFGPTTSTLHPHWDRQNGNR